MKFVKCTDNVDIEADSLGISPMKGLENRGLCIQIRHNGDKELFEKACKMVEIIVHALNEAEEPTKKYLMTPKIEDDFIESIKASGDYKES